MAGCLCTSLPSVETRTRVLLVRHFLERFKTTNTARLAALALRRCELVTHGAPGDALDLTAALAPHTYLLFPGGPPLPRPPRVDQLVVVDGSWSQSRRMVQRLEALRRLPRLSLPAPTSARRRLRQAARPGEMATLEAIAHALETLEGPAVAAPLHALFDRFVERVSSYRAPARTEAHSVRQREPGQ